MYNIKCINSIYINYINLFIINKNKSNIMEKRINYY